MRNGVGLLREGYVICRYTHVSNMLCPAYPQGTIPGVLSLVLASSALVVALVAAVCVVVRPVVATRRLAARCNQLEADVDDLYDRLKRTQNREARRASRDKAEAESAAQGDWVQRAGESKAEWKTRVRGLINAGQRPVTEEGK